MTPVDITPEDSVVPVFLDEAIPALSGDPDTAPDTSTLEAALAKLMALGLTLEEARAVAGLPVDAAPIPEEAPEDDTPEGPSEDPEVDS